MSNKIRKKKPKGTNGCFGNLKPGTRLVGDQSVPTQAEIRRLKKFLIESGTKLSVTVGEYEAKRKIKLVDLTPGWLCGNWKVLSINSNLDSMGIRLNNGVWESDNV